MTRFSSKWILSHSTWYKFRRSGQFVPDHQPSIAAVSQFRDNGFKLIWFDGNRPAALRQFQRRATVPEIAFYIQMYRIENSRVVDAMKPVIINPFDTQERFKPASKLLQEIRTA